MLDLAESEPGLPTSLGPPCPLIMLSVLAWGVLTRLLSSSSAAWLAKARLMNFWKMGPVFSSDRWIEASLCGYRRWKRYRSLMAARLSDLLAMRSKMARSSALTPDSAPPAEMESPEGDETIEGDITAEDCARADTNGDWGAPM